MRVLGIDPGLLNMGWGIVEKENNKYMCLHYGCIKPKKNILFQEKLAVIYDNLNKICNFYTPSYAAFEEIYFSQTTPKALLLAQAKGVALLCLQKNKCSVMTFSPNTIKKSVTGSGHSTKDSVQKMVQFLLKLPTLPEPDHASDALACAICYLQQSNIKI